MRRLFLFVLPLLYAGSLCAQSATVQGNVTITGSALFGAAPAIPASDLMGLTAWSQTYAESTAAINAMQFVYSPFQQMAALPYPAADECTILYGGLVYVIGGYGTSATNYLNYVQIYNPTTNSWTQGATKTTAEWGAGCALYGGKIYMFGGAVAATYPSGTTNAEVYDIAGNSWSSLTSLPSACIDGVMAITVGSDIYVMWQASIWKFDPTAAGGAGSYVALATPPSGARVEWAATGYMNVSGDDRIYFLGGSVLGPPNYTNTGYYYSVTNDTWSGALATAPYAAHGMAQGTAYAGNIYYIGGYNGSVFFDTLYAYTPATDTWSTAIASMNAFRDGVGGVFIGDVLYVMGGRNANAPYAFGMADNEAYKLYYTPTAQVLTTIQLHYTQASPTGSVRLGIYTDAGASGPGNLILDAGATTITNGWTSITGLTVTLTPGTRYWLAFIQSANNGVDYTSGKPYNPTGGAGSHCFATATYGALPSTFPSTGLDCTGDNSMYAEQMTR